MKKTLTRVVVASAFLSSTAWAQQDASENGSPEESSQAEPDVIGQEQAAVAETIEAASEEPVEEESWSDDDDGGDGWGDEGGDGGWGDDDAESQSSVNFYGFIDAYAEKVAKTPAGVGSDGNTDYESNPHEFDVPNLNFMMQASHGDKFRAFLNLAAPGAEDFGVRNAWVEATVYRQYLQIRAGKIYRPFGLYNEMLDAVPTYMGIEPPELFDKDHLLLTRTTNLMLKGQYNSGANTISYALTTGNDEREGGQIPIGADINLDLDSRIKIGSSFYSSNGDAVSSKSVGEGSPSGGVLPWMEKDSFMVYGAYAQLSLERLKIQSEFWIADHNATRAPDQVQALEGSGLNSRQLSRFGLDGDPTTADNVNVDGDYKVATFYVRTGYTFPVSGWGSFTPYLQYDYYKNPETVQSKNVGGDNEAGLSDNGLFHKSTIGSVWRPIDPVAVKLDASTHTQKYNGETVTYPEVRISFSYLWDMR